MRISVIRPVRQATVLALVAAATGAAGCAPRVTTQQEVQLGASYAQQINQQLPLIRDAATVDYVNRVGRRIAQQADPRGIPYYFHVVNSDVINAFAIPGGHVYVNRGLIERADNVSEFAGVLAHEVGHVAERHAVERMERAQNANSLLGVVYGVLFRRSPGTVERAGVQVAESAIFAGYSRDAEREADRVAVAYLVRAGIRPEGVVSFFQKLLNERQRSPGTLAQWFATHPLTQERIANTRAVIQATPGANAQGLATDDPQFQQLRARLRALPPAPRPRQ